MLYIFVLLFAALLILNAALTRTILFPPALFCSVWLVSLLGLLVSGTDFFPISLETCMVFLVGAIAFSVGGVLGLLVDHNFNRRHQAAMGRSGKKFVDGLLTISLVIVLIGIPLYIQEMINIAGSQELETFVYRARAEIVAVGQGEGFSVVNNLAVLANFVAIAAWYESNGARWNKWRAYLCIGVALAYGWLSGTKGPAVVLLLSLFFVSSVRAQRASLRSILAVTCLLIVVFGAGLLMVNYAFQTFESVGEALAMLAAGIQQYWLGGMVAFDQIVADPGAIESNHQIDRFFLLTANSLGANFSVPSIHPEYTYISPFRNANNYTMYFSYFKDFGWTGTVFLMVLLGLVLTVVFRRAQLGRPIAVLVYGLTATGLVMSVYAESFWIGLNGYIKAFLYFALLYYLPLSMAVPSNGLSPSQRSSLSSVSQK